MPDIHFIVDLTPFNNKIRRKKAAQHYTLIPAILFKIILCYLVASFAKYTNFYRNKGVKSDY